MLYSTDTDSRINIGCAVNRLVVGATHFDSRQTALFRFADPWAVGERLWSLDLPLVSAPSDRYRGGIGEVVGTDRLIAFQLFNLNDGAALWVGGPRGEGLREDAESAVQFRGRTFEGLQADGEHLVMLVEGEIYLYTRAADGTGTLENLTRDTIDQWSPWVSGRYVVWIDQRDQPRGTVLAPDNPEVYLYDLVTRERRRITHDAPERPVVQLQVSVRGDWIVWVDQRHSPQPNAGPLVVADQPREIYGYHIPTGREVPLVIGSNMVLAPILTEDSLWYTCFVAAPRRSEGSYRLPLPAPPLR